MSMSRVFAIKPRLSGCYNGRSVPDREPSTANLKLQRKTPARTVSVIALKSQVHFMLYVHDNSSHEAEVTVAVTQRHTASQNVRGTGSCPHSTFKINQTAFH
jgi:hypothetical protein